ncbi:MAG: 50S ribosomal protein L9 [Prevotella sp.]|nr:50S ribosomal protein L9 [Prevotella sp.]
MELILKQDVIGLGYKNDIVNVKSGYGRNYLIPTGKAVIASESAKKVLAENLRQQAHKLAAQKAAAEDKARQYEGVALEIPAKVASTGQLYGSVGVSQVVAALAEKGIEVDRKIVTMRDAKHVGVYEAVIHFHKEVEVKVPVTVVAENAEELAAEAAAKAVVEEAPATVEETSAEEEAPAVETEEKVEE